MFCFSNLPPFSIFVSQHLLKGVIKNKSSSVINSLGNRGFFSLAARSILDHRPILAPRAQLFEGRLALNLGLKLTLIYFSCVQKHFLR